MSELTDKLRRKIGHEEADDCWYSCAILTCDDKRKSDKCDCGADQMNALHSAAADEIERLEREIEGLYEDAAGESL